MTNIARNYCRLFLRRKIAKGNFDFLNKPVWLAVQTDREAHGWGLLAGGTENSGLCAFSHTHTLYFKRRGGEKNCQLTHISVILYKWAAIKSHGDTYVSTGGMVSIVHEHYTTYGLKTY